MNNYSVLNSVSADLDRMITRQTSFSCDLLNLMTQLLAAATLCTWTLQRAPSAVRLHVYGMDVDFIFMSALIRSPNKLLDSLKCCDQTWTDKKLKLLSSVDSRTMTIYLVILHLVHRAAAHTQRYKGGDHLIKGSA